MVDMINGLTESIFYKDFVSEFSEKNNDMEMEEN